MVFGESVFGGHCIDDYELSYQLMQFVKECGGCSSLRISGCGVNV